MCAPEIRRDEPQDKHIARVSIQLVADKHIAIAGTADHGPNDAGHGPNDEGGRHTRPEDNRGECRASCESMCTNIGQRGGEGEGDEATAVKERARANMG